MPQTDMAGRPRRARRVEEWADDRWTWAERARRYDHDDEGYRSPEPGTRRTVTITGHPADRQAAERHHGARATRAADHPARNRTQPAHFAGTVAAPAGRHAPERIPARQRSQSLARVHHRPGFAPDRVAMWTVFLGFALVLIAALSAHA